MSNIPDNIKELLDKHGLYNKDAAWELPQKKGTWILKHKTLEALAVKEGVTFKMFDASNEKDNVAIHVTGYLGDKFEESYGEASSENCKNAYKWSMAEKRGKDRVVLKLLGLHGDAYSEEEADDFNQTDTGGGGFANAVTRNEYAKLLNLVIDNWTPHVCPLEDLKPYFKRASDTDPELKNQLTARYKALQQLEKDMDAQAGY